MDHINAVFLSLVHEQTPRVTIGIYKWGFIGEPFQENDLFGCFPD